MMLLPIALPFVLAGDVVAPPRWRLSAAALTGTPSVLPHGVGVGAQAELARRSGPVFLSARLGWAQMSAANESWVIDHHQLTAALGVGVLRSAGVGRVWAQAGAGACGLYEVLSRHQRERIDAAGVPSGATTSWAAGPYAFAELGVALQVRGPLGVLVAAGPELLRTTVDGGALWRVGAAARLGVVLDF